MKLYITLLLVLISLQSRAHVGSPDIVYQGNAGPYPLLITIQPPDVVPGIAKILIDAGNEKINRIKIQPVYYQYGSSGAPKGDDIKKVAGMNHLYEGSLWLMTFGSSSVKVSVEGKKGIGSTIVPVPAIATATRTMDQTTSLGLQIMGAFLILSLITIIGAAIKESTIPHGAIPTPKGKRSAIIVMSITFISIVSLLIFANNWWGKVESDYRNNMFKPLKLNAHIKKENDKSNLYLDIVNPEWQERKVNDLIADHGKLMHLFLIDTKGQQFAHLHPIPKDSLHFTSFLPSLNEGNYLVFAEVVHSNGMAETLTDTLQVLEKINSEIIDTNDFAGDVPLNSEASIIDNLKIKANIQNDIIAGKPVKISFKCTEDGNMPANLQPYLGMAGHAVVMKDDASVFIHLHPMGTISMASQYALAQKIDKNVTICGNLSDANIASLDTTGVVDKQTISLMRSKNEYNSEIIFPYVFPKPGVYYIWVQVKHKGTIKNGKFKIKAV
ncbi:MAG: hypothetical protein J7604_09745 [Sporocytophaga sp.]|uniref:hypothetical protein n=1 Tax=Sporocytophaga sp. TaxID=2231183 RepID=UPI001B2BC4B9|nr:hypothetical protein [Sporocytophaga sp.]MBO9700478.1 hypothetical protein [Sporocytophaga sp.]